MDMDALALGRELDALVAENVFGLKVLEEHLTIVQVEGEPSVHVDSEPDGWMCYAETGPVYEDIRCQPYERPSPDHCSRDTLERWVAAFDADMERFGCPRHALYAVPWYSTGIVDAWKVAEKQRPEFYLSLELHLDHVNACFCPHGEVFRSDGTHMYQGEADTAPHAICLAVLRAVGYSLEEEKS